MRKFITSIAVIAMAAAMMTGCGSADKKTTTAASTKAEVQTEAKTEAKTEKATEKATERLPRRQLRLRPRLSLRQLPARQHLRRHLLRLRAQAQQTNFLLLQIKNNEKGSFGNIS